MVKNWLFALIQLDDIGLFRGYETHIVANLFIHLTVIDMNTFEVWRENVAENAYGAALLSRLFALSFGRLYHKL